MLFTNYHIFYEFFVRTNINFVYCLFESMCSRLYIFSWDQFCLGNIRTMILTSVKLQKTNYQPSSEFIFYTLTITDTSLIVVGLILIRRRSQANKFNTQSDKGSDRRTDKKVSVHSCETFGDTLPKVVLSHTTITSTYA